MSTQAASSSTMTPVVSTSPSTPLPTSSYALQFSTAASLPGISLPEFSAGFTPSPYAGSSQSRLPVFPTYAAPRPSFGSFTSLPPIPDLVAMSRSIPCLQPIPQSAPQSGDVHLPFAEISIPTSNDQLVAVNTVAQTPIKLTESNYQLWYSQWRSVLLGYDLISYVAIKPSMQQLQSAFWIRQDQLLRSAITATLSIEIAPYVLTDETSYNVWTTLHNMFAKPTRARLIALKDSLTNIKKGSLSMTAYLQKVKTLVSTLNASGANLVMDDVVLHTLNGLPPEYENTASGLKTRSETVNFDELFGILCDKERSLGAETVNDSSAITAFYANKTAPGNTNRPNVVSTTNSGSKQNFNASTTASKKSHASTVVCQFCDRPGHTTKTCWKLYPHLRNKNGKGNRSNPSANVAQTGTAESGWLVDSGASHHVTTDLHNLSIHDNYDGGEDIMLGDGPKHGGKNSVREG